MLYSQSKLQTTLENEMANFYYYAVNTYYLSNEFAFRTVKYQDQGLAGETKLAMSVRKDQSLAILQHKKQIRLMISLLYATVNTYRTLTKILGMSRAFCENLPVVIRNWNSKHFSLVFDNFRLFRNFSELFRKKIEIFGCKFPKHVAFVVFSLFTKCFSDHLNQ